MAPAPEASRLAGGPLPKTLPSPGGFFVSAWPTSLAAGTLGTLRPVLVSDVYQRGHVGHGES